jgi:hypothetical protein
VVALINGRGFLNVGMLKEMKKGINAGSSKWKEAES